MNIKILSSCCGGSKKELEKVLKEMGVTATVETVSDIKTIMSYGVMRNPGLVINEKVKCAGRVPSREEVKRYIKEEMK
jgi:translation initiation factor 6 (eIF-6)